MIFGAFIIALATILLFYLIKPGSGPGLSREGHSRPAALLPEQSFVEKISLIVRQNDAREDPVDQRVYRDHSRIQL